MDQPGRLTRGRAKTETVATTAGRKSVKSAIPTAGGRGSTTEAGSRRISPGRMKGTSSPPKTRSSPSRTRVSPSRVRISPVRRSSRPRSTIPTVTADKPISKLTTTKEEETIKISTKHTNLPTTLTTNTSSKAPNRVTTTSSTHSSYSSVTQKTVEITTSNSKSPSEITKLTDLIRRSVSKTLRGNTEERQGSVTPSQRTDGDSRYSRSLSRSVYDGDDRYSKAEFSDAETHEEEEEDDAEDERFQSFKVNQRPSTFCRKLPVPTEFGGALGALLLMAIIPIGVLYLHWSCSARNCDLKMPNYKAVLDPQQWLPQLLDYEWMAVFVAFNMGILVLSALLPGKGVRLPGCSEYKFNALAIALVLAAGFGGAIYWKYPIAEYILRNQQRFVIYSLLNAYVLALWVYFRADVFGEKDSQSNIYAKSGNFVVNYALGRELNPKWLHSVDYKLAFYRISLISVFLYALALVYENVQLPLIPEDTEGLAETLKYLVQSLGKPALVSALLLLAYVWDSIVFEHHLASSFELQGEGFGCLLLLRYAVTPLLLTSVARYFHEHRTPLNCQFAILAPFVLFALGWALKRYSNAIKYKYRLQPDHVLFERVNTIHTFQGRRLLLGALWGRLRQPNYLGDILCLVAMGLPLVLRFAWPPLLSLLLIVVLLVHRCFRVNERNTARYHSSWVRYRSIARNYLIPKIF